MVNEYLKTGLWCCWRCPTWSRTNPFWLDPKDPHRSSYARQGVLGPTVPNYPIFNPGCAEAGAQQIWGTAAADVIREGVPPQAAADKALKRISATIRPACGKTRGIRRADCHPRRRAGPSSSLPVQALRPVSRGIQDQRLKAFGLSPATRPKLAGPCPAACRTRAGRSSPRDELVLAADALCRPNG